MTTRVLRLGDSMMQGLATMDGGVLTSELDKRIAPYWYCGTMDGAHGAHDGHPGWTAGRMRDEAPAILAKTSPDLVFLSIGTNDAVSNISRSTFGDALRELARTITDGWSSDGGHTALVVGTIGPASSAETQKRARDLNAEIVSVAGELRAKGRSIVVAPVDAFVPTSALADGVHFTPTGYQAMARAFASVVKKSAGASTTPASSGSASGGVVILAIGAVLWLILRR